MSIALKALHLEERAGGRVVDVHITGKLQKVDYEAFVPELEALIREHGKVRVLVDLDDFEGWTPSALWEDIKFDARHFNDVERLAIVGEKKWHELMTNFCKPFTSAEVRYFERSEMDQARRWLEEDIED